MIKAGKKLKEKWEDALSKEGLPKMDEEKRKIEQEKVPLKNRDSELTPKNLSLTFEQFSILPRELQQSIIDEAQKQRDSGVSLPEILERTRLLIQKMSEFNNAADQTNPTVH